MRQKQLEKWEEIRAKGKGEFILRNGGVIFGLIFMGIIFPTMKFIIGFISSNFTFSFFDKDFQFGVIFGLMVAFPVGCLQGWLMWEWTEWGYQRAKRKAK